VISSQAADRLRDFENMLVQNRIAARMLEVREIQRTTLRTDISLHPLKQGQWVGGTFCRWTIRIRRLRRGDRSTSTSFHYYPTKEAALAMWPNAKEWP